MKYERGMQTSEARKRFEARQHIMRVKLTQNAAIAPIVSPMESALSRVSQSQEGKVIQIRARRSLRSL